LFLFILSYIIMGMIYGEQISSLPDGTVLGAATENGTVDESAGGSTQTLVSVLGIVLVLIFVVTIIIYKKSQKKSENS